METQQITMSLAPSLMILWTQGNGLTALFSEHSWFGFKKGFAEFIDVMASKIISGDQPQSLAPDGLPSANLSMKSPKVQMKCFLQFHA
jgi:hypothetical protein